MSAVDDDFKKEMLRREIAGIDVQLISKRIEHQLVTKELERLEKDRAEIIALLD